MSTTNHPGLWAYPGTSAVAAGPAMSSAPDGGTDWLRVRHLVADRRAEAVRLADRARWSQHSADVCWYAEATRSAPVRRSGRARARAGGLAEC